MLQRLADSGHILRKDHLLDYGCGKGRVAFFMASAVGCRVTGIDHSMKLIGINEKVLPDYVLSGVPELSDIEKKLYREVSAVRTIGGETLLRILAPNEHRDSFCLSHAEKCLIDWH